MHLLLVWGLAGFWCHGTNIAGFEPVTFGVFEDWPAFDVTEPQRSCTHSTAHTVWGLAGFWCHGTCIMQADHQKSRSLRIGRLLMSRNANYNFIIYGIKFEDWPAFDVTELLIVNDEVVIGIVWGLAGFWCHGTKLQIFCFKLIKVWGLAGFWCHGTFFTGFLFF